MNIVFPLDELEEAVRRIVREEIERAQPEEPDAWLGSKVAAEYLGCSLGRIHNLVSEGRIPHEREGGRLVFSRRDLETWIRSGRAAA